MTVTVRSPVDTASEGRCTSPRSHTQYGTEGPNRASLSSKLNHGPSPLCPCEGRACLSSIPARQNLPALTPVPTKPHTHNPASMDITSTVRNTVWGVGAGGKAPGSSRVCELEPGRRVPGVLHQMPPDLTCSTAECRIPVTCWPLSPAWVCAAVVCGVCPPPFSSHS